MLSPFRLRSYLNYGNWSKRLKARHRAGLEQHHHGVASLCAAQAEDIRDGDRPSTISDDGNLASRVPDECGDALNHELVQFVV